MKKQIHDILRDAGAAAGIKPEEVLALATLGSDSLLQNLQNLLREKFTKGDLSEADFQSINTTIVSAADDWQKAQKEFSAELGVAIKDSQKGFMKKEIRRAQKELDDLAALDSALNNLIAKKI
ncbi:MAG: hypothetical protein V2A63_01470 [Patescibacteria group bacterium]